VKYAFILECIDIFPVFIMCPLFGVSRSGFYNWKKRFPDKSRREYELLRTIEKVHQGSRETYGSPRVWRQVKALGFQVSKRKVEKIMKENGLRGKKRRRYRATTDSKHSLPISPNVVNREFDRGAPNRVWLSDITYLTTDAGWAYLATVMDAHTRKILGWSIANHMRVDLVTSALKLALGREKTHTGVILHSDRGSQYASEEYRSVIKQHILIQSMSRKGNCWDNAPMESFFDTFKTEHAYHEHYRDHHHARERIFEWIEVFYNRRRMHSSLGYLSPACFEEKIVTKAA
jgi:putative transposase